MKKIIIVISILLCVITIQNVEAKTINASDVSPSTYIIGKYMYTRNTSSSTGYNGKLTTERIMLGARTILGNNLDDMTIYYKTGSGDWIDALTGKKINVPNTFEIETTDLVGKGKIIKPNLTSFEQESSEIGNSTYVIGNYVFTRNPNEASNYDGVLTTKEIMLAAKTITGDDESDMTIYYKTARGTWINALSGETIEPPKKYEVAVVDLVKQDKTVSTLTLAKTSIDLTYGVNDENTYTYDGDGNITCSSGDTTYVTCSVDMTNHKINVVGQKVTTSSVTITVNATQGSQYLATSDTFTVTVAKKAVSITAKNQTIDYGDSITTGVNQVNVSGLVSGHTLDGVTLTPDTANVTTTGKITPSVAIIKENSTDVTSNYQITYNDGTLTIEKIDATCPTLTAYSEAYDGSAHGITVSGGNGMTIQYRTSTTGTWSNTAPTITNVLESPTTVYVQVLGDSNHNTKDCESSTITINKKEVTVKAENKSMSYGGNAPKYSYTVTGAVGSETAVSGTATYTIKSGNDTVSNVSTADVRSYTIVPGGLTAGGNYSISYANGTLTINKVDATCPTLTAYIGTYDGSAHGIIASGESGGTNQYRTSTTGTWSYTAPTVTNVSQSPTTVYVQVAGDANHNTKDCGSSTITINKREVTVKAANKSMSYGGTAPNYSYTVTGAVGSETAVSGTATYTIKNGINTVNNVSTADTGTYTIVPNGLSSSGNYTIYYASGILTISPRHIGACPGSPPNKTYTGGSISSGVSCPTGAIASGNTSAINTGNYTQTCTGTGNYTGSCSIPWKIVTSCGAGYYLPASSQICTSCSSNITNGYYCPGVSNVISSTSNQGLTPCPTSYNGSDNGRTTMSNCYKFSNMDVCEGHSKTVNSQVTWIPAEWVGGTFYGDSTHGDANYTYTGVKCLESIFVAGNGPNGNGLTCMPYTHNNCYGTNWATRSGPGYSNCDCREEVETTTVSCKQYYGSSDCVPIN